MRHTHVKPLPMKLMATAALLPLVATACLGWANGVEAAKSKDVIRISSAHQIYQPFEGRTLFKNSVNIRMNNAKIRGGQAEIAMGENGKPETMTITENVSTQMSGGDDVVITSDSQIFNQDKNVMKAIGHVYVKKEGMEARSPEALVLMGSSGAAQKIKFIKGATLKQENQEITAETITIDVKSGNIFAEKNTRSRMLTTDTQGNQTEAVVVSHLQEFDSETGTLMANGKANVEFEDIKAKGPKAIFYMKENILDRIVLNGRAEVEDPEQRVIGDTITITVNPKQFRAEGNVQSFIKAKNKGDTTTQSKGGLTRQSANDELLLEEAH